MIYNFIRSILFRIEAERIHDLTHSIGAYISGNRWLCNCIAKIFHRPYPVLRTTVAGIDFENPVGLAAGFDKPAELIDLMHALGFGFVEVGTVTPKPQPGNPRPRLFRLPHDQAILNRMGFNNRGLEPFVAALRRRKTAIPVGGNIGKNKDTTIDRAVDDYRLCAGRIAPYVDYITINVSSPNTPGLRALQDADQLRAIINAVQEEVVRTGKIVPVFVKIAPDMTVDFLRTVIDVIQERHCDGIIIANTTLSRENLHTPSEHVVGLGDGGISGLPVAAQSTMLIAECYTYTKGTLPIIGVGGIFTAQDAYDKIRAGASLIQLYTGLVYQGPTIVQHMNRELAELLSADGFASLSEAVGSQHNK